jgi:hypothetical protein
VYETSKTVHEYCKLNGYIDYKASECIDTLSNYHNHKWHYIYIYMAIVNKYVLVVWFKFINTF